MSAFIVRDSLRGNQFLDLWFSFGKNFQSDKEKTKQYFAPSLYSQKQSLLGRPMKADLA